MGEKILTQIIKTWGVSKTIQVFAFTVSGALLICGLSAVAIPDKPIVEALESKNEDEKENN